MDQPRTRFARRLRETPPLMIPLCLDALTARLLESLGFPGGYVSGGALGYAHAVSEALLTLTELSDATRHITARSELPVIVDGGVGFGDEVHVARTIWEIENTGAVAIELEDQVAPKRVSHHRGIEHLITCEEMVSKVREAVAARRDPDFLIIARTGAVRNESFEAAVERANAYADAGADILMLMPQEEAEWRQAPERIHAPLATITSLDARAQSEWADLGWALIIDPFTAQAASVGLLQELYGRYMDKGTTGTDRAAVFATYRELSTLAGLDPLYELEDRTTEKSG